MAFNIIIPEIENKPKSTKDAVINILTYEWPLTLKQVYNKIKKQYGFSCSYQSVFKAVKELSERQVLIEKGKKYEINVGWIKKVQSFTDIIETNYYATEKLQNISGLKDSKTSQDLIILTFETLFDAEKYLYYFMKTELFKKNKETVCFQLTNEWRPLFYLRAEYNYYKRLIKKGHKFYFICSGNSDLEKKYKEFYLSFGAKYKSVRQTFACDTLSFDSYFIQIFVPESLKIRIKECLKKGSEMQLLKTLEEKTAIKIIINKDKELAVEFRKNVLGMF
jgi:hypothetical protein